MFYTVGNAEVIVSISHWSSFQNFSSLREFKKKDIQGLSRFETMAWNEMLLITCISLEGNDLILIRLLSQLKRNLEDYI